MERHLKCPKCGNNILRRCLKNDDENLTKDKIKEEIENVKKIDGYEYKVDDQGILWVKIKKDIYERKGIWVKSWKKREEVWEVVEEMANKYSFFCKCGFYSLNIQDF